MSSQVESHREYSSCLRCAMVRFDLTPRRALLRRRPSTPRTAVGGSGFSHVDLVDTARSRAHPRIPLRPTCSSPMDPAVLRRGSVFRPNSLGASFTVGRSIFQISALSFVSLHVCLPVGRSGCLSFGLLCHRACMSSVRPSVRVWGSGARPLGCGGEGVRGPSLGARPATVRVRRSGSAWVEKRRAAPEALRPQTKFFEAARLPDSYLGVA